MWFLHICSSTSIDSARHRLCRTIILLKNKSLQKCTLEVQAHVVQVSTVLSQWIIELMPSPISKNKFIKNILCVNGWIKKFTPPPCLLFKVENQQGPTVKHKELCSILCGSLDGRRVWGRMDTYVGEYVISSVLSHCSKNLQWQSRVTAWLQLNFIWQVKENTSTRREGRPNQNRHAARFWLLFLYVYFSSSWACHM